MRLTGRQYEQLLHALIDAFPAQMRLAQMVRFRLDKNLNALALGENLQDIVFRLIEAAQADGWLAQLIAAARESNPGNPSLLAFAQQFSLAPNAPRRAELEKIIKATQSFLDINMWRERLGQIEGQVCRIEIAAPSGLTFGTGFLLGPDVLMTNYHVMESVILGQQGMAPNSKAGTTASDVILRFDYKQLANGGTINPGTEYRLADAAWLLDHSPYVADNRLPQPDELDYVLLRIDGEPGYDRIGHNAEPEAPKRGWIEAPAAHPGFRPGDPLFIVQHPAGDPLKLAFDTNAILDVNENGTIVRYTTNTLPGSSGSPCFDSNWTLVALHHSGDPNWKPTYNAGTPIGAILARLEQRGLRNVLGAQAQ